MQVTNFQLVMAALIGSSAMLNDGATIVGLLRTKNQKRSASVIDMLTEFAINELEDMSTRRCESPSGPDVSQLNFVGRRPFRTVGHHLDVVPFGERLTKPLQNHSAEAFRQITDRP